MLLDVSHFFFDVDDHTANHDFLQSVLGSFFLGEVFAFVLVFVDVGELALEQIGRAVQDVEQFSADALLHNFVAVKGELEDFFRDFVVEVFDVVDVFVEVPDLFVLDLDDISAESALHLF
jgi:hypothetical protein